MVLILMASTVCFAEIYGKVTKITKNRGNLRIKVSFYDSEIGESEVVKGKVKDLAVAKESFYIADNDVAESNLEEYIRNKIAELNKPKPQEVVPTPEVVHANISVGKKVERVK